jgi:hypothetical protein
MQRVMAILVLVLALMGCAEDNSREPSSPTAPPSVPSALQADFPDTPFNAVVGVSPRYQASQVLSPLSPQSVTSTRYVMTVSMF